MQMSNSQLGSSVSLYLTPSTIYRLSISLFFWLFMVGINLYPSVQAAPVWTDVSSQAQVDVSAPIRSRRSPDAWVKFKITNTSGNELVGPLRLVIVGLTPDSVTLAGAIITTGEAYVNLDTFINTPLAPGEISSEFQLTFVGGGGRNTFSFTTRLEQQEAILPSVVITSPETLITVGSTPIQVSGTVNIPDGLLTINGNVVEPTNGQFQAAVTLEEGLNTIIARLTDTTGNETTDSIVVSMDLTAPYVTIESPTDGQILNTPSTAVSGLINDIVRGTVSEADANVTVNGIPGSVSNRSYLAQNIPLQEGANTITVTGSDQVGNVGTASINVTYQPLIGQRIELQTGQNQTGPIRTTLSQPLIAKVIDDNDQPLANKNVIFRVTQGDGLVGVGTADEAQATLVTTDINGFAQTQLKLGSRSGNGNNRVRATSVGVNGEALFYASATSLPGNKVSINSGNNQRGTAGQPLPQPFIVAVTDEGANVVEGTQVEFLVTTGGGQFQNGQPSITATTDGDGRAIAHLTLGAAGGFDNNRVTATLVGTSISAGFTASGLISGDPGNTRISGVVFDNQDNPLPGVTLRVDGTTRQTQADAQGYFLLTEVPVGPVHLLVDGATTTVPGEWPTLSYNLVTVAGAENSLPAPIYMVKLNTDNAVMVGLQDAEITLDEMPGFKLEVKAGSVTFPDGSRSGLLSVTPVNTDKIPMPPPNGMQPQVIVTIQPVNTRFDPPAKLTLPNVDGHAPGAQVEMYSYDHDLEEFVAIGLGTVTADGSLVSSNPGIGVIKAGWHCGSQPGGQGCASNPGECQKCTGDCVIDDDDSKIPSSITDTAGDCTKPVCSGGSATEEDDDTDIPTNGCCIDGMAFDNCGFGLVANDVNVAGPNNVRTVSEGGTLTMVTSANNIPEKASIIATKFQGVFENGQPAWSGQTSGVNGDTNVFYNGTTGQTISSIVDGETKSIELSIVRQNKTSYTLIPGTESITTVMDLLNNETSFGPGNRFRVNSSFTPSGNVWTVEMPNSPRTTKSYSGEAAFSGSLTGRISHPTLSGQFPPGWLPGDPWALWELYAEASIGLSGSLSAQYLNEYVQAQLEFQGTGSINGTLQSGAYAIAQVLGYETEGDVNANVGVSYSIGTSGVIPHKKLEGAWNVNPLTFNTIFNLKRSIDGRVIADFSFSHVIWNGYTQHPKTLIYEQPQNP